MIYRTSLTVTVIGRLTLLEIARNFVEERTLYHLKGDRDPAPDHFAYISKVAGGLFGTPWCHNQKLLQY